MPCKNGSKLHLERNTLDINSLNEFLAELFGPHQLEIENFVRIFHRKSAK